MAKKSIHSAWTMLLLIQRTVSTALLIGAIAFPCYILYRQGFNALPLFDRGGNVAGHVNYFAVPLGFSAFSLLIGWLCFRAAQKGLRKPGNGK